MERQYYPQCFRYLPDGRKVGTIDVGEIFYIPDNLRAIGTPVFARPNEPWRVEAWIPREAITWNGATRRFGTTRCAGGHLALVRSLRDSQQTRKIADWILLACSEAGLTK